MSRSVFSELSVVRGASSTEVCSIFAFIILTKRNRTICNHNMVSQTSVLVVIFVILFFAVLAQSREYLINEFKCNSEQLFYTIRAQI